MVDASRPSPDPAGAPAVQVFRTDENTNIQIIDPIEVEETLVDGILGVGVVNNLPRIDFFRERTGHGDRITRRVVVARLAMTPESANMLIETLRFVLNRMEQEGIISFRPPVSSR